MSAFIVLGVNDEVTTCECCGRAGLKKTVVLGHDGGEVRYGTECAARAMKVTAADVARAVRSTLVEAESARRATVNAEWDAYTTWLQTTYGDTRSDLARRRAWRAAA